jgi:ribosome biogenesis GTPase
MSRRSRPTASSPLLFGLVLKSQSGRYLVRLDAPYEGSEELRCRLRGRLKKDRQGSDLAVIGDRVRVAPQGDGKGTIEVVEERRTRFSRRHPGPKGKWKEDVIVANLDQVVLVFACTHPPMNPRTVDRFLVIAEHNGVEPLLLATKIDELDASGGPEAADAETAKAAFLPYRELGYSLLFTSVVDGRGLDPLREQLRGKINALIGPSGVGKSSLLNALMPELGKDVASISELLHKGKHTTRVAELHPLSEGGYVADTPGIRELFAWQIPERELAACFPEMRPYLGGCAFSDCLHMSEPRCAVREAVAGGAVTEARYDSYRRQLLGEERGG